MISLTSDGTTRIWRDDVTLATAMLAREAARLLPTLQWRHHGIGVLQAYVSEGGPVETRIHVWSPRLVKYGIAGNGDIHDHRFRLRSFVLVGAIQHEVWTTAPDPAGNWTTTRLTHARAAADSGYHGPMTPTTERLAATKATYDILAGSIYEFAPSEFHRSAVDALAVTWVEKYEQRDDVQARLLHRVGVDPVPAFGHTPDAGLVDSVLAEAVAALLSEKR